MPNGVVLTRASEIQAEIISKFITHHDYSIKFKHNIAMKAGTDDSMRDYSIYIPYDFDSATAIGFLKEYGLDKDFKMNIEVNHATLAQHTMQHEMAVAAKAGMLGSIDANRGDYQNGWDTDQFPNNIQETTEAMLVFLEAGGLQGGGVNFDAKIRRNSTDMEDVFHAHIGGADTFARALLTADKIMTSSSYNSLREKRYSSFDAGKGKDFEGGKLELSDLYKIAQENGELSLQSGKQELFENIINQYI